jgi:hypothetical protein
LTAFLAFGFIPRLDKQNTRMARKASSKPDSGTSQSSATIGFEAKLWLTADKLRNNMDAAEPSGARQTATGSPKGERGGANQYKHVVFGFIFLKYGVKLGGISTYVHGKLSHIAALAA